MVSYNLLLAKGMFDGNEVCPVRMKVFRTLVGASVNGVA